jgi:hypothetical protein
MEISNKNLYKFKYSEEELIKYIDILYQYIIVRTQENLSKEFINNYILNSRYNACSKDEDITMETIASYQPHYFNSD